MASFEREGVVRSERDEFFVDLLIDGGASAEQPREAARVLEKVEVSHVRESVIVPVAFGSVVCG